MSMLSATHVPSSLLGQRPERVPHTGREKGGAEGTGAREGLRMGTTRLRMGTTGQQSDFWYFACCAQNGRDECAQHLQAGSSRWSTTKHEHQEVQHHPKHGSRHKIPSTSVVSPFTSVVIPFLRRLARALDVCVRERGGGGAVSRRGCKGACDISVQRCRHTRHVAYCDPLTSRPWDTCLGRKTTQRVLKGS